MIRWFVVRDFKGHRDTQLELGRFTMLVGDNASGKSSVLDALALQARVAAAPVATLRDDLSPDDLLRRGSDGPITFCSEGVQAGVAWATTLELTVGPTASDRAKKPWRLSVVGRLGEEDFVANAEGLEGGGSPGSGWDRVGKVLGAVQSYRLRAEQIAAAAYSDQPEPRIEADGTNTAAALEAMKLSDDEAFQRVEDAMRRLIPAVERVRIRQATVQHHGVQNGVVGSKLYFDFRGAPGVPAHGASHGTLIVLALLAVLHGPARPGLILLDDLDHALHPRAQMELVRMIKELLGLREFSDLQVLATTHSPYVLDELEPSDVQAFALRGDGTAATRRLSEHPDAARTRGTLKAGQLWSLDPERDWVLRG